MQNRKTQLKIQSKRCSWCMLFVFLLGVLGCTSASTGKKDLSDMTQTELSDTIDVNWLSGNEEEISRRIVAYVEKKNPVRHPHFPRIVIDQVTLQNTLNRERFKEKVQVSLNTLSQRVVQKLLPPNRVAPTWHANLTIAFRNPRLTKKEEAMLIAYNVVDLGLCWGASLERCQIDNTQVVLLKFDITTHENKKLEVIGVGAANLDEKTVAAASHQPDPEYAPFRERNTKALVAAVADATDKLKIVALGSPSARLP